MLTGYEIENRGLEGDITITPWDNKYRNPVSVDLTLGDKCLVYQENISIDSESSILFNHRQGVPSDGTNLYPPPDISLNRLDSRKENKTLEFTMDPAGFQINPGVIYLMHTVEVVGPGHHAGIVSGKSSIGRLGIAVHITAGLIDPGFSGQITLEVTCIMPVILYPGMRICQVSFHEVVGPIQPYAGNYQGEYAQGPIASRSFKQVDDVGK